MKRLLYNKMLARIPGEIYRKRDPDMTSPQEKNCPTPEAKPVYAYRLKNAVYVNTTSRCSNVCDFCIKFDTGGVGGYDLVIPKDPSVEETVAQIDAILSPEITEIVFCGLGESTYRLDFMESLAAVYRPRGLRMRLNTNGHGNHINGADIVPRLAGIIDSVSISLNAQDARLYESMCNPVFDGAYEEMLDFSKKCVGRIKEVVLTVIDMPGIDVEACMAIAASIGAGFRIRPYIPPARSKKGSECDVR